MAGIIDGEGSINTYFRKNIEERKGKGGIYGIFLQIVNTDRDIIQKVRDLCNSNKPTISIRPSRKPCYHIVITRNLEILNILENTIPYLTGYKRDRAKLALEYCKSRGLWTNGRGHQLTSQEVDLLREIQMVKGGV